MLKNIRLLPTNWLQQPELFTRYWSALCDMVNSPSETVIVGKLPANAKPGKRLFVSDAVGPINAGSFMAVVSGGGDKFAPVVWDGFDWRIG